MKKSGKHYQREFENCAGNMPEMDLAVLENRIQRRKQLIE
jgi:hypothetical protein